MSEVYGKKVILALIKKSVCDGGFASEADLARGLNIVPQKLNRWKKGKSAVSTEGVTLAFLLMEQPNGASIKKVLSRQSTQREMMNNIEQVVQTVNDQTVKMNNAKAKELNNNAAMLLAQAREMLSMAQDLESS